MWNKSLNETVRWSSIFAVVTVMIAGSYFVSAALADGGRKGDKASRYEHRGERPNFVGFALHGLLHSKKELGLSAEQESKIKVISTDYSKERIKGESDIKLAEVDVRANVLDDKVDLGTIEASLRKSESARTALRLEGVKALREASAVLTPEQREKWHQMMNTRGESRMEGYRHPPMAGSHDHSESGG